MLSLSKKFLIWLKPTVEGDDGKSSARRLTAFWIVFLYTIGNGLMFYRCEDWMVLLYLLVIDAIFILMLFGIITVSNLITFWKIKNNSSETDTTTTDVTVTDTEISTSTTSSSTLLKS